MGSKQEWDIPFFCSISPTPPWSSPVCLSYPTFPSQICDIEKPFCSSSDQLWKNPVTQFSYKIRSVLLNYMYVTFDYSHENSFTSSSKQAILESE